MTGGRPKGLNAPPDQFTAIGRWHWENRGDKEPGFARADPVRRGGKALTICRQTRPELGRSADR